MGEEAPEIILGSLNETSPPLHGPKSWGSQTSTVIANKTFVVEGSVDGAKSCLSVKIFYHSTASWSVPAVLGAKPVQTNGHSALLLSNDRITIIKRDALLDDCIWFLEIDTPIVREQKQTLGTEVVAWSKGVLGFAPKPIVISGPSGVGKGTLIAKLMKEFPSKYGFSVSHTTRAPREKEINGVHYHFTERIIMEKDIKEAKFLEFASVHGNLYGTSIEAVEVVADSGKRCILDIDVQGARSVRASPLKAIFIFIAPPSFDELEKRLCARGTETEEQVQKRLRNAKAELDQANSGLFDHVLINDDLEACYENLKKLLSHDETVDASFEQSMKNFKVPVCHIVSENGQKILVGCGMNGLNASKPNLFWLDASFLNGGAPGRTRGLNAFVVDSIEGGMNGTGQL